MFAFQMVAVAGLAGLAAGLLSSVAGLGGGLALVAIISIGATPHDAVALTAPVIALGAVDRAWMYRSAIDQSVLGWLLAGAVPLALAGALVMTDIPADSLRTAMASVLLVFIAYQVGFVRRGARPLRIPVPAFGVVGMLGGGLAATVGGGGPVTAPFIHGRGLRREAFVGTESVLTGFVNLMKTAVFAVTGALSLALLPGAVAAAVGMPIGNRIGRLVLGRLSDQTFENLLLLVLAILAFRLGTQGLL